MDTTITVAVAFVAPVETVWGAFTTPDEIMQWSTAPDGTHTTECTVDLREGGHFHLRREAKDGRSGSNFDGTITLVLTCNRLEFSYGDHTASAQFDTAGENNVTVTVVFNAESEETITAEQEAALSILQNFAAYVQSRR